jgi:putative ABC transport system ATP-binding protein
MRKRKLGFVFQHYNLFPSLTALENVAYALNVKGVAGPEARQEAEYYIDAVGLRERKAFLPARALAGKPKVLLADEPTANLDSTTGAQVLELLRRLVRRGECGVLVVAHDHRVREVCDRVLQIRDGRLVTGPIGGAS